MNILAPFQLLELNIISAQDLEPVSRKMRTYAVAWVHPERKLTTRIDTNGHTNPTWNDKFVFRVDDEFIYGDTSAVMIEIYAVHWFRDIHVGTVRVIVGNLIPQTTRPNNRREVQLGMSFAALQVWRPSGRPQGILNIGVALLDSSRRSMPLYTQMGSSAVGYQHLMGEEELQASTIHNNNNARSSSSKGNYNDNHLVLLDGPAKPQLRRTKSDTSSMVEPAIKPTRNGPMVDGSVKGGSMVNVPIKSGSMVNGFGPIKSGSMVNGFGPIKGGGGGSMVNGSEIGKGIRIKSRGSSMVNYTFDKNKLGFVKTDPEDPNPIPVPGKSEKRANTNDKKGQNAGVIKSSAAKSPPGGGLKFNWMDNNGAPRKMRLTDSELGPSPSEVAANVARNRYYNKTEETEGSSIDGWSLDESMEGLRSKLDRWRTELPNVYDRGEFSSFMSSAGPTSTNRTRQPQHGRRHTTDNGGLFSCFGNICGCEISVTCGPSGGAAAARKRSNKLRRTPSVDNMSFL